MQHRFRLQLVVWFLLLGVVSLAQSPLQQLRDQLVAANGWRDHDVVALLSQRALNDTAARLAGLEITLSNGVTLKLDSAVLELKPAVALVQLGVAVNPSSKFKSAHFRLSGRLGSGEIHGANLRLPFQLTDVAFGAEDSKSLSLLKLMLRDWLKPAKWNEVLPPLEVPLQLNPTIDVPAATFEVDGEMPMTLEMPAYQLKVDFTLAALAILDGRAVVALNLQPKPAPTISTTGNTEDEATLANEIGRLTQHLALDHDVRVRMRKNAINDLLSKLAAAREIDLTVKLKQGRLRAEEVDALIGKVFNYTDVESGDGYADVARLSVEDISPTRLSLRLAGQGEVKVNVKGREYGIPYSLSPHTRFSINDELIPLTIAHRNERLLVQAVPGVVVPVSVYFALTIAGRSLGIARTMNLRADEWVKGIELPALFTQAVSLPRKIAMSQDAQVQIVSREISHYSLADLRLEGKEDALEMTANLVVAKQ